MRSLSSSCRGEGGEQGGRCLKGVGGMVQAGGGVEGEEEEVMQLEGRGGEEVANRKVRSTALLTRVLACFGGHSIEVKDISLTDYIQVSSSSNL